MYVCMCVFTYVCMYARTHAYMYACVYMCMYVGMHVCMYVSFPKQAQAQSHTKKLELNRQRGPPYLLPKGPT